MTYRRPPIHPSSYPEGVLGRLMRAFPARTLSEADAQDPIERAPAADASVAAERREPATPKAFLARLDAWLWRRQQQEREAYLSGASDVTELEARMRQLEARRSRSGQPI